MNDFDHLIDSLRSYLSNIPDAKINVKEFEQGPDAGAPIEIYIKGDNLDMLSDIAIEFEDLLKSPAKKNITLKKLMESKPAWK